MLNKQLNIKSMTKDEAIDAIYNGKLVQCTYADIKKGMKVVDNAGDIGIVTECEDAHNVIVQYENDGRGIYCLVEDCELFEFESLLYVCA